MASARSEQTVQDRDTTQTQSKLIIFRMFSNGRLLGRHVLFIPIHSLIRFKFQADPAPPIKRWSSPEVLAWFYSVNGTKDANIMP